MNKLFVLLLCLTAILSRKTYREDSNDLIDIITCILKYKSLIDDFDAVIDIINSKDYLKLLTLIPQIVSEGKKALEECSTKPSLRGLEEKVIKLKKADPKELIKRRFNNAYTNCIQKCTGGVNPRRNYGLKFICQEKCLKYKEYQNM